MSSTNRDTVKVFSAEGRPQENAFKCGSLYIMVICMSKELVSSGAKEGWKKSVILTS